MYNYKIHPNTSLLQSNQTPTQELENLPLLREEVEEAVHCLKAGDSPGVGSISSELLQNEGKLTTTVLTAMCMKMWETKKWPKKWTQ